MSTERLTRALTAFVRQVLSSTDYHALYPARVVLQHGDGTLEVLPDDERLPGMTGVPIRLGIPGVTVKVAEGARVLLGFEGGNPAAPIATLWESHGIEEISLDGGSASVARVGDKTSGHTHSASHALTVQVAPPPAPPVPVVGTITINSATDTIAEGAKKVKA